MSESPRSDEGAPIPARIVGGADPQPSPSDAQQDADSPKAPSAPHFDDRPASFPVDLFEGSQQQASSTQPTARVPRPATPESNRQSEVHLPRRRRVVLPVVLFFLTCLSTFWVGCSPARVRLTLEWIGVWLAGGPPGLNTRADHVDLEARSQIIDFWQNGLIYMVCVIAILFAHEMGHFIMTLRYRVAASLPYFIPMPLFPIGTMGAVISMDGQSADRKQIFDIGIAGPIAGLVLAIPITWYGVSQLDLTYYDASIPRLERVNDEQRLADEGRLQNGSSSAHPGFGYHMPWMISKLIGVVQPKGYKEGTTVDELPTSLMNPFLMAGWFGLLITGLNMMPISQLDGGHVIYGLFGKRAHVIARMALFMAIFFVVYNFSRVYMWTAMLILVTLIGTDHPPTANDDTPLGLPRIILGWATLAIPFACFPFFGLWELT